MIVFISVLISFFGSFISASPQAKFEFPSAGQVVPLGTSSTNLSIVVSYSGFTPDQGRFFARQNGIILANFPGMQQVDGPPPVFLAVAAFGIDLSGEIELVATLKDSVSGETAVASTIFKITPVNPIPAYLPYSYFSEPKKCKY